MSGYSEGEGDKLAPTFDYRTYVLLLLLRERDRERKETLMDVHSKHPTSFSRKGDEATPPVVLAVNRVGGWADWWRIGGGGPVRDRGVVLLLT